MWLLLSVALAGPAKKMDKLLEKQEYEEVIVVGEKYLGKNPEAKDADEVHRRLAEASFELASQEDSLESWRAFNETYPDSTYRDQAMEREAKLAWEAIKSTESLEELAAYQQRYPEGPHTFEARTREANLAWQAAEAADTEDRWRGWVDAYADDPRLEDARARQASAALRYARETEDVDALLAFIEAYPDSADLPKVYAEILSDFSFLDTPCSGSPVPRCEVLQAGEVLRASWVEVPGRSVTATFVRWTMTGTKDLQTALTNWAGSFDAEAVELAHSLTGESVDNQWTLELPVDLKTPSSGGGYAVRLTDGENEVLLKVAVGEAWGPATTQKTAIYTGDRGVWVGLPGGAPHQVATVDPGQDVLHGRFLYRYGSAGLQRVDVDQGRVDTIDSSAISGVWASDGGLIWEREGGELMHPGGSLSFLRNGAHVAVHPDGGKVALLHDDGELRVRVLLLDGSLESEFTAPTAGIEAVRWTREGLVVLAGPELALAIDPAAKTIKPTDHRKATETITGVKLPWKVTGAGTFVVETQDDGLQALVVVNGPSRATAVVLDPEAPWRLGEGCTEVSDVQATWLPDGRIAARLVREHCGDQMNGTLVVVNAAGGTPVLLESHGSGLPDWLLSGWHGGVLLLPDGRSLTGAGLEPAPGGVSKASWYVPGLYSLL